MPASASRDPADPDAAGSDAAVPHRGSRPPLLLLVPALLALAFLLLPLAALVVRAPWSTLPAQVGRPEVLEALRLSLLTAAAATLLCVLLGVPLAWLLARTDFPGRRVVRALVTVPMVLPPVVGGVALLMLLGRSGLLGARLDAWFGVSLPFTTAAVVVAQTFVALPFLVIAVEGSLRGVDRRYELAALTLGASRLTVFRRVTLPLVAPGLVAGGTLCFARALGEFGATITFAGSFPGVTTTMPILVYLRLQSQPSTALVLSLLLLIVSVVVLASLRERWVRGGLS